MADKELLKNGSGVKDQTAYDAMKNFEKRKHPAAGELWTIEGKDYLVVNESVNGTFVTALKLVDETPYEESFRWAKVTVFKKTKTGRIRLTKYTDTSIVGYVTLRKLVFKGAYHDTVSVEELDEVRKKMAASLGISIPEPAAVPEVPETVELPECIDINYKALYDDLIDRLIKGNLDRAQ